MGDVLPPKRQAVVDRLRRRIESYRRRQSDCIPRFDQSFNGLCEQNIQETLVLKQRFLESKAKRAAKKTDKKQDNSNNLHTQQKFLKRTAEELEPPGGSADAFEPPAKIQCTGPGGQQPGQPRPAGGPQPQQQQQQQSQSTENLTKFSVEIVQQLEFTTSAANSQPQQISTNVTVKALTNASVKSDVASPKSGPGTPASTVGGRASGGCNSAGSGAGAGGGGTTPGGSAGGACVDLGNLVECKQEPDSEFVDLEQCAAALEKDAAANGASFPGFSDLIGDDTSDEIMASDAFKDLISEISDFHPEFMKDFDFEDKSVDGLTSATNSSAVCPPAGSVQLKAEDENKDLHHVQQQHQQPTHQNLMDVVGKPAGVNSPSPLMAGNPQYSPQPVYDPQSLSKSRMAPYPAGLTELSPAAQTLKQMAEQHQHKTQLGMSFNPAAARNVRSPYGEFQFPTTGGNDYLGSPTGAPPNSAGAPPYLNKQGGGNSFVNSGTQAELIKQEVMFSATQTAFTNNNLQELQKRQVFNQASPQQSAQQQPSPAAQQTPVSQQTPNKQTGVIGGGYSTAKQQYSPYGSPGPLPNHGSPQYLPRGQAPGGPGPGPQQGTQHVGQFNSSTPPRPPSCPGSAGLQINQAQQMQINQQGQQIQVTAGQHMQLSGDLKPGVSVTAQQGMYFSQQQAPPSQPPAPTGDSYTVSQSQTINFTQQSLRQRPAGRPGVDPTVGNRQALEQQHVKLLQQQQQQQQQILRAQALQQQSHMAGMGPRPPPPEYKANPQLMHGLMGQQQSQQRFSAANMRRVGQQPMPPSGPMMRPQQQQQTLHGGGGSMYIGSPSGVVQHQQHHLPQHRMTGAYMTTGGRNNQRPPNVSIGPDGLNIGGRGSAEWRHLLISQQQNAVFGTQMRPSFPQSGHQGSFGMGSSGQGGMQMSAAQQMQHQQMVRNQALSGSPVSQMQMLSQQQSLGLQQSASLPNAQGLTNATQMSMNLQMSQSLSVSGGGGGSPHHHPHHPHHSQQPPPPQQQPIVGYGGSPVGAGGGNSGPPAPQQHPPPTSNSAVPVSSVQQSVSQSTPSAADFSLEFLEHLPTGDSSHFSAAAQELLNSLDSASTFNLDIL